MKGIILAGGHGTRLWPLTSAVSKQLLPLFNKPMIYYPLATLMQLDIKEILIIINVHESEIFKRLFGDGSELGINISYAFQDSPEGIAQALSIGEEFLKGDSVALILGDNIFHGFDVSRSKIAFTGGAMIFGKNVVNPENYGVVELDNNLKVVSLEEKPTNPKSNYAVTGLYLFDREAPAYAKTLKKSNRNEFEIIDLLRIYLDKHSLALEIMPEDSIWFDCGTAVGLNDAANYIRAFEERTGSVIGSVQQIAISKGWIEKDSYLQNLEKLKSNNYARKLLDFFQ